MRPPECVQTAGDEAVSERVTGVLLVCAEAALGG